MTLIFACAGLVLSVVQGSWRRLSPGIEIVALTLLIQVAGVYVGLYRNGLGPQGRYLFPVIGPFMCLLWIGIQAWFPQRICPAVGTVFLALMLVLDLVGWTSVVIPTYVQ